MSSFIEEKFSSAQIIAEISSLQNNYVHPTEGYLLPIKFTNKSKKPFNRIKHMIAECENLEKPYDNKYVFSYLVSEYNFDIDFLSRNIGQKLTNDDFLLFKEEYEKVIIKCIKVYLFDNKYETNNIHFIDTIQKLCKSELGREVIPNIFELLEKTNDILLNHVKFTSLCKPIEQTDAHYAVPQVGIRTRHTDLYNLPSVSATEAPPPVNAVEEPLYINQETGQPVYHIPISWNPNPNDRLTNRHIPPYPSSSRGGKRKTKKHIPRYPSRTRRGKRKTKKQYRKKR